MFDEISPTIASPLARSRMVGGSGPLSWRVAAPLIGGISIGLWMLVGKAVTFLIA